MPQHLTLTSADGSQQHPLTVPTCWADVRLADYIRLLQQPTVPAIVVLCGISAEVLGSLAAQDAAYLGTCLSFLADDSVLTESLPQDGLTNIGAASYGQLLLVQQFMEQHPDEPVLFYAPWIYAVYESERVLGSFNSSQRMQLLYEATLARPITEVYADVLFMLGGWLTFTSATPPPMTTTPRPTMMSSMPAWKRWAHALAASLPWTRSAAATRSATGPSSN
jgi:hypothetical protein